LVIVDGAIVMYTLNGIQESLREKCDSRLTEVHPVGWFRSIRSTSVPSSCQGILHLLFRYDVPYPAILYIIVLKFLRNPSLTVPFHPWGIKYICQWDRNSSCINQCLPPLCPLSHRHRNSGNLGPAKF